MSNRTVDLVSYLPAYLKEYQELVLALEAEDPEFDLIWDETEFILNNQFILTADDYGLSRFESLLGLTAESDDTLETRRARILAKWFIYLPYSLRKLLEYLAAVVGDGNVTVSVDSDIYTLYVVLTTDTYGAMEEVDRLLLQLVPANLIVSSSNEISCEPESADIYFASGICVTEWFQISNDYEETYSASASALQAGGAVETEWFQISNDAEETYTVSGDALQAGGIVDTTTVVLVSDE